MTENYILIKTHQQQDLENILCDLANLYRDTEYVKGIQLYRKKGQIELFLIRFTKSPDLEKFGYFVNYLVYPMDVLEFQSKVRGYYRTADVNSYPKLKSGDWLMLYINSEDQSPENVYITNENNQSFIYDFGKRLKQLDDTVESFTEFAVDPNEYNHIIDIFPSPEVESAKTKPWWKFW
ncbi:hypothetical protein [Aquimarina sp. AU58]|uniref:hypothetical protein n=1 Tax=Aquimarina sp. AU58 TaxID=1874112 RepID=UPI000D6541AF|nr:hypothetical protein [Aquimarina sp. AU58]